MLKISNRFLSILIIGLLAQVGNYGCTQRFTGENSQLEDHVLRIIQENPKVIKEALNQYPKQQEHELQQTRSDFLQQLKINPKSIIQDSPRKGSEDLRLVLIEFSDFQCPFCSRSNQTLQDFLAKYQDEVTLVYKHLPLSDIHPEAVPAAEAAWAAGQQNKFWEYHDALFEHQDSLGEHLYLEIAKQLNLDLQRFNLDRGLASEAIYQDIKLAESLGINGTPFFIMNEEVFSGAVELEELEARLQRVKKKISLNTN